MRKKKQNLSPDPDYVLVYSTDKLPEKRCSGCSRLLKECVCKLLPAGTTLKPALRIERKGRAGKSVTVVFKLPPHSAFLKNLCAYLKKCLGTGGTEYIKDGEGCIEIQGERTDEIRALIETYQIK